MAKRRKRSLFSGKHAWTKGVLTTLAGATVGVVANKAMNDAFTVGGWNPSVLAPLVASDIAVLGAEIGGAYYLAKKRGKHKASKFLISMASGSVAADVLQVAGNANWWNVLSAPTMRFGNGLSTRTGRYGNNSAINGKIGGFMTPIRYAYPRR